MLGGWSWSRGGAKTGLEETVIHRGAIAMTGSLILSLMLMVNVLGQDISVLDLIEQGKQALNDARYVEAEHYLRLALKKADSGTNELDKVLAQTNVASLLTVGDRNAEAEDLLKSALKIVRSVPVPDKHYITAPLIVLGGLYTRTGEFKKAESVLKEAEQILSKDGDADISQSQLLELLNSLGVLYATIGNKKLAQARFEQAMVLD